MARIACIALTACGNPSPGRPDASSVDGGGSDGSSDAPCGLSLIRSGSLDLDLPVVRVTGTVTLDGAALPAAGYRSPRIELRGTDGSTGTIIDLQSVPSGSYDTRLIPGTYDVFYTEDSTSCTGDPYPCQQSAAIRRAVAISGSGALDLDIRTIRVTGRITLDGAAPPSAGYALPVIGIAGTDRSTGTLVDLSRRPTGQYDVRLLAGTYDLLYSDSSASCTGLPYPCQVGAAIRRGQSLQASGALDLDIATIGVSGRVTLDGAALPSATYPRPRIALADGESTGLLVDLALHADGQYQTRLLAGRYDVVYAESAPSCTGTPFPCQQGVVLRSGASLTANGAFDLDIPTVLVAGQITLDGAAPPRSGSSSPVIEIGGRVSTGVLVDLARATTGAYQTRVIPGTYDVGYTENVCGDSRWPCQQHRIMKPAVRLTAPGALDVDVRTVLVSGQVTLDQAPPPAAAAGAPIVTLLGEDGSSGTLFELRRHPDGAYQARLLAGAYTLFYSESTCTTSPWPCLQRVALRAGVAIASDGALDIDVPTIHVSGRVTLAGAALPAVSNPPQLALRDHSVTGTLVDLARVTAGAYQTRLVPGRYTVLYEAAAVCDGKVFPCQHARAVQGCEGPP